MKFTKITIGALGLAASLAIVSCGENSSNTPTGSKNEETAHGDFAGKAWERTDEAGNRHVIRFKKIAKAGGYALMKTTYCKDMSKAAVLAKVTAINSGVSSDEARKQTVGSCVAELRSGTYTIKVQDGEMTITEPFSKNPDEVFTRSEKYDLSYSCEFKDFDGKGQTCMEVYDLEEDKSVCSANKGKVSDKSCKVLMNKSFEQSCALNTVKDGKLLSQMMYFYEKDKPVTCPN